MRGQLEVLGFSDVTLAVLFEMAHTDPSIWPAAFNSVKRVVEQHQSSG
jgi:hypothetical protein